VDIGIHPMYLHSKHEEKQGPMAHYRLISRNTATTAYIEAP
jgi:hypothetical protein